jgi:hypothetical protein
MEQLLAAIDQEGADTAGESRSVEHEYTLNCASILRHLGASLLVSTDQAGKVVVVRHSLSPDGQVTIRVAANSRDR